MYNSLYNRDPYNNNGQITVLKINNFNLRVNFVEHNNFLKLLHSLSGDGYFIFKMREKCQVSIQCVAKVFQVVGKLKHLLTKSKM
jgi:hypothetical protein